MESKTFLINCTNPIEYLNSLQSLGNKKHKLWNGFEMAFDEQDIKTNCQIFIKEDLHFYRTDYHVQNNILLKVKTEKVDQDYVDFRIDNLGGTSSIIHKKELQLQAGHQKEKSFHIFLKKKLLNIEDTELFTKRQEAHQSPVFQKMSHDILSIPASGNRNALLLEGKLLELSYRYLEYIHAPVEDAPSFLASDYKRRCINEAKKYLDEHFVNPPTIKILSKTCGVNSNQLKIGFKHLFNSTIRQYVINRRLECAQQLITNTRLPLGTICNKVGYVNHGHFSKLYKEKFGVSPLQEREK